MNHRYITDRWWRDHWCIDGSSMDHRNHHINIQETREPHREPSNRDRLTGNRYEPEPDYHKISIWYLVQAWMSILWLVWRRYIAQIEAPAEIYNSRWVPASIYSVKWSFIAIKTSYFFEKITYFFCSGTNEHPIARKNTILRQGEAPSHCLSF